MTDIFLSYNREDQARAKLFAEAFERHGFKVWWDVGLKTGEAYDQVTEKALREAKAVVVLWSKRSVESRWVRAEATLADRNKTLVPCMIEPCERPIMFELTQTAELMHWQGDASDAAWRSFLSDVYRFVAKDSPVPMNAPSVEAPAVAPGTKLTGRPQSARPSLAILPFTNRSAAASDEVIASGMGEDIAAALSLGRGLRVISQSATVAFYKNMSDLRLIGRELGARYILEGNVRRVSQTLRVTAQLVEAESGAILWAQKYDRPLAELAELQEDLVDELAAQLGVQVKKVEMERALQKPGDITAWEAVMRSAAAYAQLTPEGISLAVMEARRAVSLAPDYAVARGSLAMALAFLYQHTGYRDQPLIAEALVHAEEALKLNASHAPVMVQVAYTLQQAQRYSEANELARRAVELHPRNMGAHQVLASMLIHYARFDEALAHLAQTERVASSPLQRLATLSHKCWALYGLGRLDEAYEAVSEAVQIDPSGVFQLMTRPVFLQAMGRTEEAKDMLSRMRKAAPGKELDYWTGLARGSYMPETMFGSYSQHFIDVWNAAPEESGT
ncbi:MAG: TIR domain-containing protein [Hyphomonadaceae bacterium]